MNLAIFLSPLLFSTFLSAQKPHIPEQVHKGWIDLLSADQTVATGLKHWRNVNVDKTTFRISDKKSKEGGSILICTGKPTGLIRSAGVHENFLVEFHWRHMTRDGMRANAGFFVWSDGLPAKATPFSRGIEIQVANFANIGNWFTRHGDVFAIHGAKMKVDPRFGGKSNGSRSMPVEFRAKGTAEWNHYRLLCIDGTIQLEVNGKVVSGGYHAFPRKGHLMIESEGGEVHFKNMRVLPLPSSGRLKPEDVAKTLPSATTITSLYNGLDLKGWTMGKGAKARSSDYALKVNSGEISKVIGAKSGSLILDWKTAKSVTELPFSLDDDTTKILLNSELKKGTHRAKVELKTGKIFIDGQLRSQIEPSAISKLTLRELGERAFYNNILLVSE